MAEEKLRILDLFKEGKISGLEALELLDALNESAGTGEVVQTEPGLSRDNKNQFTSPENGNFHHLEVALIGGGDLFIRGYEGEKMVIDKPESSRFWQKSIYKQAQDGYKIFALSGVNYEIQVPFDWDLTVYTAGGDIRIHDISGQINGKTLGGDIWLSHTNGLLNLTTTGGDIELHNSNAEGNVHTLGGDVIFRNVTGNVAGTTLGGQMIRS